MSTAFSRAPHIEGSSQPAHPSQAPNAALLIDFDNVTMGMRSDLSKEMKTLLASDIIRGKVTVQRAYADWRRYPQYIVPLSEASVDLIFAPAYGSSKKNATDIRMAIDGMELVFTRPEIGTYILLTGDSDFSSLVLKLKEYGKYVIGVGIQESSSDILVQNCDEYYSYTALSGLRKSTGESPGALDPWVLVERAVEQMKKRNDVMRSDRLKQVMLEIDPGFEEKSFGFNKFSRFLTEAAQKGLLRLRKLDNGQYEVSAPSGDGRSRGGREKPSRERKETRSRRDEPRKEPPSAPAPKPQATSRTAGRSAASTPSGGEARGPSTDPSVLAPAYDLLRRAIGDLLEDQGGDAVRDSDVKRRMLALESGFDEAELGFSKFSRFLRQAHDHEVVELRKGDNGQYQVALGSREPDALAPSGTPAAPRADTAPEPSSREKPGPETAPSEKPEPEAPGKPLATQEDQAPPRGGGDEARDSRRLRPRLSSRRRGRKDEPPPLFEGQVVGGGRDRSKDEPSVEVGGEPRTSADRGDAAVGGRPAGASEEKRPANGEVIDPSELNLPTGRASVIKYLANSYRGVGQKTAENLVDELGPDLFRVLQTDPSRVSTALPPARAEKVLEAWREDFARRRSRVGEASSR